MSKEGEAGCEDGEGGLGGAGPRARGLSGRGAGGAQMLAAVESVTSTSQWQLALFNAWSHGGGGVGGGVVRGGFEGSRHS